MPEHIYHRAVRPSRCDRTIVAVLDVLSYYVRPLVPLYVRAVNWTERRPVHPRRMVTAPGVRCCEHAARDHCMAGPCMECDCGWAESC